MCRCENAPPPFQNIPSLDLLLCFCSKKNLIRKALGSFFLKWLKIHTCFFLKSSYVRHSQSYKFHLFDSYKSIFVFPVNFYFTYKSVFVTTKIKVIESRIHYKPQCYKTPQFRKEYETLDVRMIKYGKMRKNTAILKSSLITEVRKINQFYGNTEFLKH